MLVYLSWADWELLSVWLQHYLITWCDTTKYSYCWYRLNSTNVTGTLFKTPLFAGDTYTFYVRAVTAYGEGKESSIQVNVPSLDLQVSSLTARSSGSYGLQVYLSWNDWYIPSGLDVVSIAGFHMTSLKFKLQNY